MIWVVFTDGNYDKDKLMAYIKVLDSLVYDKYIIGHGDLESEETALVYLMGELSKL